MPEDGRVEVRSDVVFGSGGGRDLRCDVYVPPGRPSAAPAVLLVHGGGWARGDRTQLRSYGLRLGRAGYVCIAPEYRLTGESPWPAQIEDLKAAIRWTRTNASQLGIDPDRIALEGNSAGAHLALLAAGTPGLDAFEGEGGNAGVSTAVSAAIGIYTPTMFSFGERARGAVPLAALVNGGSDDVAAMASPITHVGPDFPPTMLVHGTADTTVPPAASLQMYEALVKAGVPVELHMYAEQPHAFDARPEFGRQVAGEMALFLERYLAPPQVAVAASA